ncbi:hypothetical protein ACFX11_034757 [Malus domestica]
MRGLVHRAAYDFKLFHLECGPRNGGRSHIVLPQVVGIPLFGDFFIAHSGEGVTASSAYLADFVWTFANGTIFLEPSRQAVMKAFFRTRSPGWNC